MLCVPRLMSSVHEMDCLREETVSVSGRSGAQSSVAFDQMVTVQRGSVLDVRGPEWFYQPFFSLRTSTVPGEWGGLYQWFAQQFGLFSVVCIMQTNAINIIKSYLINVLSARVKFESPKIHLVKTCFVSQIFFWANIEMHDMWSGLQAGQFSTRTLLLRSHAFLIAAVWGFALSCWNTCHLEGSICCTKTFIYLSALCLPKHASCPYTYAPPYHQNFWLLNWTLITRWKVYLLFSPEDMADVIFHKNVKFGIVCR